MKHLLFVLLAATSLAATAQKPAREWDMFKLGILPNTGTCQTERYQQLIDSAYSLPGETQFNFLSGFYYMTGNINMNFKRNTSWFTQKIIGNTASRFTKCEAMPQPPPITFWPGTNIDFNMIDLAFNAGIATADSLYSITLQLGRSPGKKYIDSLIKQHSIQLLKQLEIQAQKNAIEQAKRITEAKETDNCCPSPQQLKFKH